MRKPEDMGPKKIKKPDTGYVGETVIFDNSEKEPVVPAYITTKSVVSAKAIRIHKEKEKAAKIKAKEEKKAAKKVVKKRKK
jgi:hypothetical protein